MKAKTLFFDLDDTLYSDLSSNSRISAELTCIELFCKKHPKFKLNDSFSVYKKVKAGIKKEYRDFSLNHNRELWFIDFLVKEHAMDVNLAKQMRDLYWKTLLTDIEPFYDMALVLPHLAKKYNLCVLTNGIRKFQVQRIRKLGIGKYFDAIITSSDAGYEKPHKEIFSYALNEMKTTPSKSFMIGDSPYHDIAGAKRAGLKTIWLRRGKRFYYPCVGKEKADFVITNGVELLSIL